MANGTKAELLAKAAELGIQGLSEASTMKDIKAAIDAKEAESSGAGEGSGKGEGQGDAGQNTNELTDAEAATGIVLAVALTNIKFGGVYYKKDDNVKMDAANRDALAKQGLVSPADGS